MFDIKTFGKNLVIKSNKTDSTPSDRQMFIDLIELYVTANQRSLKIEDEYGFKLDRYEGLFYTLIENLFYLKYGDWQSELILWYVYDRIDDETNEICPLLFYNELTGEESEITMNNPNELYSFIQKLDKQIKQIKKKKP